MCTVKDTVNGQSVRKNISVVVLGEFCTDLLLQYKFVIRLSHVILKKSHMWILFDNI